MEKPTYEEYLEAKHEVHLTEFRRALCNRFYVIMKKHVGKKNAICSDAIAKEIGVIDGKVIKRAHINEAVRILREYGKMPNLISNSAGYYLGDTLDEKKHCLRFIVTKIATLKRTAYNLRDSINRIHGEGSIPNDVELWLELEELEGWCQEQGIDYEKYLYEHGLERS